MSQCSMMAIASGFFNYYYAFSRAMEIGFTTIFGEFEVTAKFNSTKHIDNSESF